MNTIGQAVGEGGCAWDAGMGKKNCLGVKGVQELLFGSGRGVSEEQEAETLIFKVMQEPFKRMVFSFEL